MREAGFGRGIDYTKDKKVRGDKFIWLTQVIDGDQKIAGTDSIRNLVEKLN